LAMLSLGEASRLTGRGKTTLARAIRRGVLSATASPDRYSTPTVPRERTSGLAKGLGKAIRSRPRGRARRPRGGS
jgi:hypothetical protein